MSQILKIDENIVFIGNEDGTIPKTAPANGMSQMQQGGGVSSQNMTSETFVQVIHHEIRDPGKNPSYKR